MPTEHVPVLATELLDASRPTSRRDGDRLHLRRRRPRPAGRRAPRVRRNPGRHRPRPGGRAALRRARGRARAARPGSCEPTSPMPSTPSASEGVRADVVYLDLGMSSLQLDAAERGLLLLLRRTARHAHGPGGRALRRRPGERVARGAARRRSSATTGRSATRARSPARSCGRRPLDTTAELVEAIRASVPPAYRFGRGHPAKRTFQALRIAVNGELDSLDRALPGGVGPPARPRPPGGDLVPLARGPPRQALPCRPRTRLRVSSRAPGVLSADASRRPSRSPGGHSPRPPRRSSATPARTRRVCAAPGSCRGVRTPTTKGTSPDGSGRHASRPQRRRTGAELPQGEPRSAVRHPREPRRRASGVHAPHAPTRGRRCPRGSSRSRSARRPAPSPGSPSRAWSTASRAAGCGSALLTTLLVGIVALNVFALSFNASSSRTTRQTDVLQRQNSALQGQIAAAGASSDRRADPRWQARNDRARARLDRLRRGRPEGRRARRPATRVRRDHRQRDDYNGHHDAHRHDDRPDHHTYDSADDADHAGRDADHHDADGDRHAHHNHRSGVRNRHRRRVDP